MIMMMKVDDDDDDCDLVMKVILVKEVMSCDVSPVAMFLDTPHPQIVLITSEEVFQVSLALKPLSCSRTPCP